MKEDIYNSRNPYISSCGDPMPKKSIVAYLDMLAYKTITNEAYEQDNVSGQLIDLRKTLSESYCWLSDRDNDGCRFTSISKKDSYAIRYFTDNIVIGYPLIDENITSFFDILIKLAFYQLMMVNNGYFVRGAITVGDIYIDDIVVFGKALIEAYECESKFARDPRIIFTESAKQQIDKYLTEADSSKCISDDILIDADDIMFINYLESVMIAENEHGPFIEEIEKHKQSVEHVLSKYSKEPKYLLKYAWCANYHNFFCDKYPKYFTDDCKIDLNRYYITPRSIE